MINLKLKQTWKISHPMNLPARSSCGQCNTQPPPFIGSKQEGEQSSLHSVPDVGIISSAYNFKILREKTLKK